MGEALSYSNEAENLLNNLDMSAFLADAVSMIRKGCGIFSYLKFFVTFMVDTNDDCSFFIYVI